VEFNFMLTRDDQNVADCLELVEILGELQLRHVGFKDVGVGPKTLALLLLHNRIKDIRAASYLEMVSTSPSRALESARMAVELSVDWLMGGTWVKETLDILDGSGDRLSAIRRDTRRPPDTARRNPGTDGWPLPSVRENGLRRHRPARLPSHRRRTGGPGTQGPRRNLPPAGRSRQYQHRRSYPRARCSGADAFTIRTAATTGSFSSQKHTPQEQVRSIMNASSRSLP
jgi:hypothetical protein